MAYALGDTISKAPLGGGIEITDQQYQDAMTAKLEGREALVIGGILVVRDKAPTPEHIWEGGEWIAPPEPEPDAPTQEEIDADAKRAAQGVLSHMLAASIVTDDERPEGQRRALMPLFPRWRTDEVVVPGDLRRHGEGLFECVQGHTTQADWEPNNTPALWKVTLPAGQIGPWKQPAGTHDAYQIGDRVTHNGSTWTSSHANNVWEPGVFGWVEE